MTAPDATDIAGTAPLRRVNWVTHLPAPYRAPVFRYLQRKWDLEIQCTERDDRIGEIGSVNRGVDWATSSFPDINFRTLRTLRFRWRDVALYLLLPGSPTRRVRHADVVLIGGWEVPAYWQFLLFAKLRRKPVVGFYESPENTNKFRAGLISKVRSRFFRSLDAVVTPGLSASNALRAMGVQDSAIFEGFNAVDVAYFHRETQLAREEQSPAHGHRFLYVGQMIARKRVLELLAAFARARGPEDTLTFVGNGEQRDALVAAASKHGVSHAVHFVDYILNVDLPAVFARHDTLCLVSREEVWGLVVNEALAAGLRTIVARGCGVAPSVADMEGVYLVADDLSDLDEVMREVSSRPAPVIDDPEILQHDPEAFALVFDRAFRQFGGR